MSPWRKIPWTLDGEFGGVHDEVVIKDEKQSLQIMVKEEALEKIFGKRAKKIKKNTCIL